MGGKSHKQCGDGVIRTCISWMEAHEILEQLHDGLVKGHVGSLIIIRKILVA